MLQALTVYAYKLHLIDQSFSCSPNVVLDEETVLWPGAIDSQECLDHLLLCSAWMSSARTALLLSCKPIDDHVDSVPEHTWVQSWTA